MNKIEELTEEIQRLENDYADALAGNENQFVLQNIWQKIKELRSELVHHLNMLSPTEKKSQSTSGSSKF